MKFFVLVALLCAQAIYALPIDSENPGEYGDHFEGDIVLSAAQQEAFAGRTGLINTNYRWRDNTMPYVFDTSVNTTQQEFIRMNLDLMQEQLGCFKFVPRTNEADYVRVTTSDAGCFSYVGRIGGAQQLNLQQTTTGTCFRNGIVQHEFIHALGFYHMHSATERDDFVTIVWENIEPGRENAFNTYPATQVSQFGVKYDVGSVMHYAPTAFSVNGKDTIVPHDDAYRSVMGQRVGMSDMDIERIKNMYCPSTTQ